MKNFFIVIIFLFGVNSISQEIRIDTINILGNKKTKTSFITKLIFVKSGMVLDSVVLKEDIQRLKRLPSISHAFFEIIYSKNKSCIVQYNIVENLTIIPSVNIYTTNDDEFAYRIGINEFNLFGQNIAIGGFYQNDIYSSYAINFRVPYLFGKQFGLALNHQNLTTQEPIYFDDTTASYKYNNTSYEIIGLYEFNSKNKVELGVNFFSENYSFKSGATSPDIPQNFEVDKILYKTGYEYSNLDYDHQYVSGFRSTLILQYVTSGDVRVSDFLIGYNDFYFYKRIGKKGNWANKLRLGLSSNDKSPFAPFTVDNNVNIRGVGNEIDRGTGAIIINTEFRYTLYEKKWFILQSNTFIDAGTWRNPGGKFTDFTSSENIRIYPGIGLRFIHKKIYNAIFRIDYGVGITKNATNGFVIGVGQYF
ncbi:MAG: outer membrane protein assembly factor [Flavobacteriaceae bacterium]|nr:outer membrane protein assembly factor [Flavobacteriaceae bacterium]